MLPPLFASASPGTERALAEELSELGFGAVRESRAGVHFAGLPADAARACFESRLALRVLEPVAHYPCRSADELYAGARAVDWSRFVSPRHTFSVHAVGRAPGLENGMFVALRVKDAIVDVQRSRAGARSSVDREDPDLRVLARLAGGNATVYVDHGGGSLHRRGYRRAIGAAPLKETLAAAVLRYSGWRGDSPLFDPCCGAGTLLLEGALLATRTAPGLLRSAPFGFERWADHDEAARRRIAELRGVLRARVRAAPAPCAGRDRDPTALEAARDNARAAGMTLELREGELESAVAPAASGAVVANPPHGRRLAAPEDLALALAALVDRHARHDVALLVAADLRLVRTLRTPRRSIAVDDGGQPCRVWRWTAAEAAPARD
ncbi:MAG: RNA methyltransferase [Polyangiaceae bacterium]|nr:RNA methyltransferase [Polyangiaceae bacterium]